MTPLGEHLAALIASQGPVSVADYMALALGHPEHGYYATRDPLGAAGDFITAPEISQMFGELIGLWCADLWQRMGAPGRVLLAELGPGRGTLMQDALRAAGKALPAFAEAAEIHLVETSPALRAAQRARLGARPHWHEHLARLPEGPLLLVANEFFDALPIRQFVKTPTGWHERCVTLKDEQFAFALSPLAVPQALIPAALRGCPDGSVFERGAPGQAVMAALAARLEAQGGAALIVDYGHTGPAAGETLQAVRGHRYCDPLDAPGTADLTAHVDFAALLHVTRETKTVAYGPVPQGQFLKALGIEARAAALKRSGPAETVDKALARLVGNGQMGDLFKAMAVTGPATPVPAGFES